MDRTGTNRLTRFQSRTIGERKTIKTWGVDNTSKKTGLALFASAHGKCLILLHRVVVGLPSRITRLGVGLRRLPGVSIASSARLTRFRFANNG